jgi:hypothetical protein
VCRRPVRAGTARLLCQQLRCGQHVFRRSSLPTAMPAQDRDEAAEEPDIDDLVLDDEYYRRMGITREAAQRQQAELSASADPDASWLDGAATLAPDVPASVREQLESREAYGPSVRSFLSNVSMASAPDGPWHMTQGRLCTHSRRQSCLLGSGQKSTLWCAAPIAVVRVT